jgi:signal transduction histidine kinase
LVALADVAVRRSATDAALSQLETAAGKVASLLSPKQPRAGAGDKIVAIPAIHDWLSGTGPDAPVQHFLDSLHRVGAQQMPGLQIRRRDGRRLFSGDTVSLSLGAVPYRGLVGKLVTVGEAVRYVVATPLTVGADTLGALDLVRPLTSAGSQGDVIAGLVGRKVTVAIGNADGSVWTNLTARISPPIADSRLRTGVDSIRMIRGDTLASVAVVSGAPWVVWIGQPSTLALATAGDLFRRLAAIAAFIIVLGTFVSWITIRALTAPLDEMAGVSRSLAAGNYHGRMRHAHTGDELGTLATSFNAMAERIEAHHHALEEQVSERTAELEQAMDELHTAQDQLVRRERLALLGHLAGGVGHELRNPLGVMTNAVYILELAIPSPEPIVRDYLGILRSQITLSEKIVSDLLDYARTKPPQRVSTRFHEIADQQISRLGLIEQVTVTKEVCDTLPMVDVDPTQIGQVLFNLLTNAAQSIPADRPGTVRCVATEVGDGTLRVDVIDTGSGMSPETVAKVFEPLFTTKPKGLGLGLSVSRMLTENNGGRLSCTSILGQGTTFTLTLPLLNA